MPLNLKGKVASLPASDTEKVLKALEGVVEEGVKLSPIHVRFLQWVGDYYMTTPGEVTSPLT